MINTEIPVYHKRFGDKAGRGLIVGDNVIVEPNEDGTGVKQTMLLMVVWENMPTPCPSAHLSEELICAMNFDEVFGTENDDDDDNDDEGDEEVEELELDDDLDFVDDEPIETAQVIEPQVVSEQQP